MNARVFLFLFATAMSTIAEAGTTVIDDFTDPAAIELPDGPEGVVTQGVGNLNAERSLRIEKVGNPNAMPIGRADIDLTAPGELLVDMDDAGDVTFVSAYYSFAPHDFSQYEAIILDVVLANSNSPPALMVIAQEYVSRPYVYTFVRDFPRGVDSGRLILPLDSFTDRGGGPADGDWSAISEFTVRVGAGGSFGPWEFSVARISLGPAIPEPATMYLAAGCVGWLLLSRLLRRSGSCLVEPVSCWRSCR